MAADSFDWENCNLEPFKNSNKSYYKLVELEGSDYNEECWLKIGVGLDDTTGYVYDGYMTYIAGVGATLQAIFGIVLNSLVLWVLSTNNGLKKEYLKNLIFSVAVSDLLCSAIVLPVLALKYFSRLVFLQFDAIKMF